MRFKLKFKIENDRDRIKETQTLYIMNVCRIILRLSYLFELILILETKRSGTQISNKYGNIKAGLKWLFSFC